MQNSANKNIHKEWDSASADAAGLADRAVTEVKKINPDDIKRTATEITSKVRDFSADYYDDAVTYIRRNPVSAALGLCAAGFLAGVLTASMRKSA